MGIVASIKKGFSITVSSLSVVSLLFVFGTLFNLINLKLAPPTPVTPNTPPSPSMIGVGIVYVLITIFMQAGSMGYVRDKIKQGSANFSNFMAAASKYYLKIFILSLVVALIIGAFVLVAALLVALIGSSAQAAALGIAIVIAAIGVYVLILLFFAPYIAVLEEKKTVACLSESVKFVRVNILKVLGISLILIGVGFVVGLLIGLLVGVISKPAGITTTQIIFAVLSSLVNAFLGFFVTSSFMSFYLGRTSEVSAPEGVQA